jgi:hypothetical protein
MKNITIYIRLLSSKISLSLLLTTLLTFGFNNLLYSQLNLTYSIGGIGNFYNNSTPTTTLSNPIVITGTKCYVVSNGLTKFLPISNGQFFTTCEVNLDYVKLSIRIFPNPVATYTVIKFLNQLQVDDKFRLQIFSSVGDIIEGLDVTQKQFLSGYHLNLNNLSPGVYYIQISSNTVLQSFKILKQ